MKPAKLIAGMALLCAAALPVFSRAQDYPSRSIVFVVPFTPGTAADSLARLMQPHISQRWGVPVVVENKPGAAGIIGIDSVAKANPDGYTFLFTSTAFGTLAAMNPKLPYDPDKSFAPVMQSGRVRMLAVMSSQRAQALPDVPTIVESGFPNMIVEAWTGVMVPAKTPPAVIGKFNDEVNKVLALQDVKAAAARIDVTLAGGTPETLDALVKKEIKQWTQVVQRANIKPE